MVWKTLEYKGPAFPPEYHRLPAGVKLRYNQKVVKKLSPEAEEAALQYSNLLLANDPNTKNRKFNANFFEDFRALLTNDLRDKITNFGSLNFNSLILHSKKKKAQGLSVAQKQKKKESQEAAKKRHGVCIIDGKQIDIGNWMVEPPVIFRGRPGSNEHGRIKSRIRPEDVTINCSGKCPPPPGKRWKEVIKEPELQWVAKYTNNLGHIKFVYPSNLSAPKQKQDKEKYDNARELKRILPRIRSNYERKLKSASEDELELGLATCFIDNFGIRVGNEKGKDEIGIGCTTLKRKHISWKGNRIFFNFKGKDSIPFKNNFVVKRPVLSAVKTLAGRRKKHEQLFSLNAKNLNDYLKTFDPNLSAKVFRTYHASSIFEKDLRKVTMGGNLLIKYKTCNLAVAKFCNHKKSVKQTTLKMGIQRLQKMVAKKKDRVLQIRYQLTMPVNYHKKELLRARLQVAMLSLKDTEEKLSFKRLEQDYALQTSLTNYIDPRISVAWCKRTNFLLTKLWTKQLIKRFDWAKNAKRSYRFQ